MLDYRAGNVRQDETERMPPGALRFVLQPVVGRLVVELRRRQWQWQHVAVQQAELVSELLSVLSTSTVEVHTLGSNVSAEVVAGIVVELVRTHRRVGGLHMDSGSWGTTGSTFRESLLRREVGRCSRSRPLQTFT